MKQQCQEITERPDLQLRAKKIWIAANPKQTVDNALLIKKKGKIQEIGPYPELKKYCSGPTLDLGEVHVAPPLINAHTHLELSHLKGKTCLGQGFVKWVKSLIALPLKKISKKVLINCQSELTDSNTIALGDITGHSPQVILKFLGKNFPLSTAFIEVLGFTKRTIENEKLFATFTTPETAKNKKQTLQVTLSGHALYSTSPERLSKSKAITKALGRSFAIHLAEHFGEVELLTTGKGEFAQFLKERLLPKRYSPPGLRPVIFADHLNLLDNRTLAIHCVQLTDKEIGILADRQVKVCLCPRSNALIGVGQAPWEKMQAKGIMLCLGTDSLASNRNLSLWQEAKFLLQNSSGTLSLANLLAMLTCNPAQALGLKKIGRLTPGAPGKFSIIPAELIDMFDRSDFS